MHPIPRSNLRNAFDIPFPGTRGIEDVFVAEMYSGMLDVDFPLKEGQPYEVLTRLGEILNRQ